MHEGRERDEWGRLSHLLATLANCHRNPKLRSSPFSPSEFNPFSPGLRGGGGGIRLRSDNIQILRAFIPKDSPN